MYEFKQTALNTYNFLVIKKLKPYGYYPHTNGMWKHKSHPITFCHFVDDFGVKYWNKKDVDHLIHALKQHYKISFDWKGKHYCGFNLQWNYNKHNVNIIIPDFIPSVLIRFQHTTTKTTYNPYKQICTYNQIRLIAVRPDTSPPLSPQHKTKIRHNNWMCHRQV